MKNLARHSGVSDVTFDKLRCGFQMIKLIQIKIERFVANQVL